MYKQYLGMGCIALLCSVQTAFAVSSDQYQHLFRPEPLINLSSM